MKITWKKDPRVPITGQWTTSGKIYKTNEDNQDSFEKLVNFLDTTLTERSVAYGQNPAGGEHLKISYQLDHSFDDEVGYSVIRVPFEYADTLLNFISTMGWEYKIGE